MNKKKINSYWRFKTFKMTYILAGKLDNKPFIYVDKVVNFNPNEPPQNKIYHSVSNPNIAISLTGDSVLMDIIKEHDETLHQQGQVLTVNEDLINQFATELEMSYDYNDLSNNFIYVIDENNLIRYDLKFSANDPTEYDNCTSIIINDGEYLYNANNLIDEIPIPANAEWFSRFRLRRSYTIRYNNNDERHDIDEYFKEGFSFYSV